MKKISSKRLRLDHQVLRELSTHELAGRVGGLRNDSLDEQTCNPCGDFPTTPYRGCNTVV